MSILFILNDPPYGTERSYGSCMDARGSSHADLIDGTHRSSMDEITRWTKGSGKVLVF